MTLSDLWQVLLELFLPLLILFSIAILVKVVIRRFRLKNRIQYNYAALLFYLSAGVSLLLIGLAMVFPINAITDYLFNAGIIGTGMGFTLAWLMIALCILIVPPLVTYVLCSVWPSKPEGDQRKSV
jgi:tellurite resistance protein TehA-like permease